MLQNKKGVQPNFASENGFTSLPFFAMLFIHCSVLKIGCLAVLFFHSVKVLSIKVLTWFIFKLQEIKWEGG
jgi:hypothetical protein